MAGRQSVAGLTVVRHAPAKERGVCYGWADVEVALPPDQTAARVLEHLAPHRYACVWSSSARRCVQPARLLAERFGAQLYVDERLREFGFGRWEGRTWDAIKRDDREVLTTWMRDWQRSPPPGGECPHDVESRVRDWLQQLPCAEHLLVAHAGVIRAIRVLLHRASWVDALSTPVPHLVPQRFVPATWVRGPAPRAT